MKNLFELHSIPGNWFDLLVAGLLLFGMVRGAIRGMSEELLALFHWLTVVVVCGLYYRDLGQWFAEYAGVTLVYGYMFVYIALLILISLAFMGLKKLVGEKLVSSDLFGKWERILGVFSGAVRYACVVLVFLAVINAPVYPWEEIESDIVAHKFTLGTIHFQITKQAYVSRLVQDNLSTVLVDNAPSDPPPAPRRIRRWLPTKNPPAKGAPAKGAPAKSQPTNAPPAAVKRPAK